jgi:hypothetical protein
VRLKGKDQGASSGGGGGLATLFNMVLGGVVGTSPHMISATVMALARLLHEFPTELGGSAPQLLPAVLMLLRSKSREVIKSVLGFVKVGAPSSGCAWNTALQRSPASCSCFSTVVGDRPLQTHLGRQPVKMKCSGASVPGSVACRCVPCACL